jgi:hypothetical protein
LKRNEKSALAKNSAMTADSQSTVAATIGSARSALADAAPANAGDRYSINAADRPGRTINHNERDT